MFDNRRARARRDAAPPPPPGPPPVARGPSQGHTARFNIPLNGDGTVVLLDYTSHDDEFARVAFECAVPGRLHIHVDGKAVLATKTAPGRMFVSGLFCPGGKRVTVSFTNLWAGGGVHGEVHIKPASEHDALAAARTLFGLGPSYTADELRRAHQRLVMQWHPDRPGGDTAKMAEANHFFDLLKARLPVT